jgi:hypothetical protein
MEPIRTALYADGECVGIGIQILFESASDREAVAQRHREHPRTRVPPTWFRRSDSVEDWAFEVTFNTRRRSDRLLARSVLHPVSLRSPLWGSVQVGDGLILTLDGTAVGQANIMWLRELPVGLQVEILTEFVTWSGAINRPNIDD